MTERLPCRARGPWLGVLALTLASLGCSSSDGSGDDGDTDVDSGAEAGAGGSGGAMDSGAEGPMPVLPPTPGDCPALATGTVNVMGRDVQLWVGAKQPGKRGPVLFYWHGTGSIAAEAIPMLGPALQEIQDEGGIVASFTTTLGTGTTTGNNVWYTGDYDMADYILGCAVAQLDVDPRRIYAAGCSAGGLQAGSMVLARSSYLAGAMPNSGGNIFVSQFEDDTRTPSVITAHGSCASDRVIIAFSDWSKKLSQLVGERGGYAVDCDHGGGHCIRPQELVAAQWQFLKDHPFGVSADPYADGLPPSFPAYCTKFPLADLGPSCP